MALYRLFTRLPYPQRFSNRILAIAFLGTHIPLLTLTLYLFSHDPLNGRSWSYLAVVLTATLLGTGITLAALRAYTEPVQAVIYALTQYTEQRQLPHFPTDYSDELGNLLINVQSTLTTLDRTISEVQELSIRDELTQLYNRRFFNEYAPQLLAQASKGDRAFSLMLADVDLFKRINDRFSHQVGDRVLQQIGRILLQGTRSTDLVARFGGEEFIVAFPETNLEQARTLCERLRQSIESYDWSTLHCELEVTLSIGVTSTSTGVMSIGSTGAGAADIQPSSLETVVSVADEQLYQAKRSGRNRVSCA